MKHITALIVPAILVIILLFGSLLILFVTGTLLLPKINHIGYSKNHRHKHGILAGR
jgi:hypothetical protein